MNRPEDLKLLALDEEDLAIISAHVQDAVMKVGDLRYLAGERRFAVAMNRFIWEKADGRRKTYERRRSALVFDQVKAVRSNRLRRDQPEAVLNLLAIDFDATDAPGGIVTLIFAGGAAIRLDVECIEVRLADLGAAWSTPAKPAHDLSTEEAQSGA